MDAKAVQEFPAPTSVTQVCHSLASHLIIGGSSRALLRQFHHCTVWQRRMWTLYGAENASLHLSCWNKSWQLHPCLHTLTLTRVSCWRQTLVLMDWALCCHRNRKAISCTLWLLPAEHCLQPKRYYRIGDTSSVRVIQHYHAYLYGHEVIVITDHSAVKAIL